MLLLRLATAALLVGIVRSHVLPALDGLQTVGEDEASAEVETTSAEEPPLPLSAVSENVRLSPSMVEDNEYGETENERFKKSPPIYPPPINPHPSYPTSSYSSPSNPPLSYPSPGYPPSVYQPLNYPAPHPPSPSPLSYPSPSYHPPKYYPPAYPTPPPLAYPPPSYPVYHPPYSPPMSPPVCIEIRHKQYLTMPFIVCEVPGAPSPGSHYSSATGYRAADGEEAAAVLPGSQPPGDGKILLPPGQPMQQGNIGQGQPMTPGKPMPPISSGKPMPPSQPPGQPQTTGQRTSPSASGQNVSPPLGGGLPKGQYPSSGVPPPMGQGVSNDMNSMKERSFLHPMPHPPAFYHHYPPPPYYPPRYPSPPPYRLPPAYGPPPAYPPPSPYAPYAFPPSYTPLKPYTPSPTYAPSKPYVPANPYAYPSHVPSPLDLGLQVHPQYPAPPLAFLQFYLKPHPESGGYVATPYGAPPYGHVAYRSQEQDPPKTDKDKPTGEVKKVEIDDKKIIGNSGPEKVLVPLPTGNKSKEDTQSSADNAHGNNTG